VKLKLSFELGRMFVHSVGFFPTCDGHIWSMYQAFEGGGSKRRKDDAGREEHNAWDIMENERVVMIR
jgi:hypothetical protein